MSDKVESFNLKRISGTYAIAAVTSLVEHYYKSHGTQCIDCAMHTVPSMHLAVYAPLGVIAGCHQFYRVRMFAVCSASIVQHLVHGGRLAAKN